MSAAPTCPGLLPCVCILVTNIDANEAFLSALFGGSGENISITRVSRPFRHTVIRLSAQQSITIAHKPSCDAGVIAVLQSISVTQIFVTVKDLSLYQTRATSIPGATLTESNVDSQGCGTHLVVEGPGPDNLSIHFMNNGADSDKIEPFDDVYKMLMTMVLAQPDKDEDGTTLNSPMMKGRPTSSSSTSFSSSSQPDLLMNSGNPHVAIKQSPLLASNVDKRIPRPVIPTLEASILSNFSKNHVSMQPNSREVIPFETEFFKGHALLVLRLAPPDPVYDCFFKGKKMFEVQVQGKFKRQPIGELYCGAEASHKMELGLITRSFSRAVCNFATTVINNLHYSFGDATTMPNYQLPHIVAPLFPTLDKVVVTPPGGELPPMGAPYVEDLEYRARRLKFKSIADAEIDINNTYSFSVNTANMDLSTWNIVGIPISF